MIAFFTHETCKHALLSSSNHFAHRQRPRIGAFVDAAFSRFSDQPGRVIAVFVVSPVLAHKGFVVYQDVFLQTFSVVLFVWDLWWLLRKPPRRL